MDALDPSLLRLIEALPKAELHLHLEGSIPPATAAALARKAGVTLPALVQDTQAEGGYRYEIADFTGFIRLYIGLCSCLTDEAQFEAMIEAVARNLAAQNVRWAEITVTPMTHIARGFAGERLLAALAAGRTLAQERYGVGLAWVFDVVRAFPDQAEPTLEWALRGREKGVGVVAIGIGGPEGPSYPGDGLRPTFNRARALEMPAVPHAGEQAGAASVWQALRDFHARRIGHGFRSIEDPDLLLHLREHQICLEVCPSSNVALVGVPSLVEHPLRQLMAAGVAVVLATDDPPLVGTSLNEEYRRCAQAFGWSKHDLVSLVRASFVHALMPDDQRSRELAAFDAFCQTIV